MKISALPEKYQAQVRAQLGGASFKGRTPDFDSGNSGSNPLAPTIGKYRNVKTPFRSLHGFELIAASKREAKDYAMLDLGITTGLVLRWIPQVSFLLQGGSRYRCDALVFWADGRVTVRDCKGVETPAFKIKRGLMKSTYGLEIEIVK